MKFHLVLAADKNRGIGIGGALPWSLKKDMLFFKELTSSSDPALVESAFGIQYGKGKLERNGESASKAMPSGIASAVIMGRVTWESIPEKFRPLKGRYNYIISRSWKKRVEDAEAVFGSFEDALNDAEKRGFTNTYVIGGESLYTLAASHAGCGKIYMTQIDENFNCDRFFSELPSDFRLTGHSERLKERDISFRFEVYERG